MTGPDDLPADALVRALLAPGTPGELSGADSALAAFRAAAPTAVRGRRHLRLVTGAGTVVLGLALTGGVAAAWTAQLPDPLQRAVHSLLGPVGAPGPSVDRHATPVPRLLARSSAGRTDLNRTAVPPLRPASGPALAGPALAGPAGPGQAAPRPAPATTPRPPGPTPATGRASTSPAPSPALAGPAGPAAPSAAPGPAAPGATEPSPAGPPSPGPSASPRPAAPSPVLAARLSTASVVVHGRTSVTGRLTRDGRPLAGRTVHLVLRVVGVDGTTRVATGTTGSDGSVTLASPALTRNVAVRLVDGHGVRSGEHLVTVLPALTATVRRSADGARWVITTTADGAQQGEDAVLQRLDGTSWTTVQRGVLADGGSVRFGVPVPQRDRRYRVRVLATRTHGVAQLSRTVRPA